MQPFEPSLHAADPAPASRLAFERWVWVGFLVAAGGLWVLARRTEATFVWALALAAAWSAVVGLTHALGERWPRVARGVGWLGAVALVVAVGWRWVGGEVGARSVAPETWQLAAAVLGVAGFGLHFLGVFGARVASGEAAPGLRALVAHARFQAALLALGLIVVLVRLHADRDWGGAVSPPVLISVLVLAVETGAHALMRFYQPRRLRRADTVWGDSVLLRALFGESGPIRSLVVSIETTFGVSLADAWLMRLARIGAAPALLLGLLGLWASTAVTRVPVAARGVLVLNGAFAEQALPAGLHLHAPWPWGRVEVVPTERVQELSLGFERDLQGPVLWAEKHFEGEQNLLVGSGEELLTFNVPVHYRVRDAVAFLRRTGDAAAALQALGYRELLGVTGTHTAFGLMTTDRGEVAELLRTRLQAASDRLGLGLEILFVGLKDVHPPVDVAPAYQDVVSAEEERVALVDQARTYAVQVAVSASVSANQLRVGAETFRRERRARAEGEAGRFLAPLPTYRDHPEVMTTRLRLEALEATLAAARRVWVTPGGEARRVQFFLGGDGASAPVIVR